MKKQWADTLFFLDNKQKRRKEKEGEKCVNFTFP
jgi:hypothetical protein